MKKPHVLLLLLSLLSFQFLPAQNYLRVEDPDSWNAINSSVPGWHESAAHAQLEDVTIVAEPQGIFTEIGFYATISQGPDAWSWQGEYEIIWQFELPSHTIVHDSWLWIGQDIIKADVVDYYTALLTYENIVDRNEDPSFLYQMPDNRYEIRIYPLPEGETRRIKMSFLVAAGWDAQNVTSTLLNNLLQSTDYPPVIVKIAMPLSDTWSEPGIVIDGTLHPMTDTATGGSGNQLHYIEVPGAEFTGADEVALKLPAPYSGGNTFLSTYSEGGENYYQLAYAPDWWSLFQNSPPKKSLILLDYNASKTTISKQAVINGLEAALSKHFTPSDAYNIAVATKNGVQFLSNSWVNYDKATFAAALTGQFNLQDTVALALLMKKGFEWAQSQGDVSRIFLMAANDDYVYPPVADAVFASLAASIPSAVPLTLLDYQNKNLSILFYNNEEYHGNEYFYQLLTNSFDEPEAYVFRDLNEPYPALMSQIFPEFSLPGGFLDYYTTLENGICFQRYSLNEAIVTPENKGVILQTGKYTGSFPMNIEASFITNTGDFLTISHSVSPDEIVPGDTLMREMWYGPHLKTLEAQSSSTNDLLFIIEKSIQERVLTGLTAFLALEPSQGGEPCIDCLYNDGSGIVDATEAFDSAKGEVLISPNPASEFATIRLKYPEALNPADWQATIFDAAGRTLANLGLPVYQNGSLEWQWHIGPDVKAGIYFCKVKSAYGEFIGKIIVLP